MCGRISSARPREWQGDAGTALYEFELSSADSTLMRGRATVVLDAGDPRRRVADMSSSR